MGWIRGCGYRIFWPLFVVAPLWAILAFHWAADCVLTAKKKGVKDLWIGQRIQ